MVFPTYPHFDILLLPLIQQVPSITLFYPLLETTEQIVRLLYNNGPPIWKRKRFNLLKDEEDI